MCLPFHFLKLIVRFTSIGTLTIGGGFLLAGIVVFSIKGEVPSLNNSQPLFSGLLSMGWILLAIGLIGLIGEKKKNNCCLCCFNCSQICCLAIFLSLTILCFVISAITSSVTRNGLCPATQFFGSGNSYNVSTLASSTFCKTGCPCYVDSTTLFPENYLVDYDVVYNAEITDVTQFQQCEEYVDEDVTSANFLASLETQYNCAGWCNSSAIYMFTNINRGIPQQKSPCYMYYIQGLADVFEVQAYIYSLVLIFFTISVLFVCCLCFHPNKSSQSERLYEYIKYTGL